MPWSLRQAMTGRAIEAGAHAYAAQSGSYKGLSHWTSQPEEKTLWRDHPANAGCDKRRLDWPQPNGSASYRLLGEPSALELVCIIASPGLV